MIEIIPEWIEKLEDEDLVFIKKFVLASGSLKEIAKEYDVTYPTVRLRLDRLIQKIKVCDEMDNDPYIALVKRFAVDEKIDFDTAKRLQNTKNRLRKEANDMTLTVIMTILGIILCIIVLIGVYLMIKRIIRYNSELKNGKTKRQTELEKMKIDDLN